MSRRALIILLILFFPVTLWAQGDIISRDRQALEEAQEEGVSSKILAARERLSDDLSAHDKRMREEADGIRVPLVSDNQGHFFVDVVLNDNVHASLIVDTGSPVVLLPSRFIDLLGLDVDRAPHGLVNVLNGQYKAAHVSLNSVRVGNARTEDVPVAVLLEDSSAIQAAFKDGLLGLSFLNKYHFALDQRGQRLILRKPRSV